MANFGYVEILYIIVLLLIVIYSYQQYNTDFWKSRGVVGPQPLPFFGNAKDMMFGKISQADYIRKVYNEFPNEKMVGLFLREPFLLLRDPEVIKEILIEEFSKFADRGFGIHEKTDPMSAHLVNLEPERWRPLRTKYIPSFTATKIKDMFPLLLECCKSFEKYFEAEVAKGKPIRCDDLCAKFTINIISTYAFGIDTSTTENAEICRKGREIFKVNLVNALRFKIKLYAPTLYALIGYVIPEKNLAPYFTKFITEVIKYREKHNIKRIDFINTLMEIKKHPENLPTVELTDTFIAAQATGMFAAGFETSSTTMSHALYELALNPKIQNKLREEIREYHAKNNGIWTSEDIGEMEYLEKVFKETLRMYPPTVILQRRANCNYTFKGTKITIPKNTPVWIPLFALQRDSNVFPNPDTFDPERFNEDVNRNSIYYIPFGAGPRKCIGIRMGSYETKLGIIQILCNHRVDVCEKTLIPYQTDPNAMLLTPLGGIYLKITKLET
ncbi:PREDICTED: cytochrome P450 6B1-like [Habropoda laboriosa]|uniref:cytochrome P450 6B1-like n=1 Tax=Habropoda laboriosa TaxID=597456 RepID=UPI00083E50B9|nr:PREDICTED: cytochrome P450 6B1-like [Habropoda laboriosa]